MLCVSELQRCFGMTSAQPSNTSEWQLYRVLQRANLLQYYDTFVAQGRGDIIMRLFVYLCVCASVIILVDTMLTNIYVGLFSCFIDLLFFIRRGTLLNFWVKGTWAVSEEMPWL